MTCPTCGGSGLVEIEVPHQECCQQAEFECGGVGCCGPRQSSHPDQDCCPTCHGTGRQPTEDKADD
jgi:hypothetical protein